MAGNLQWNGDRIKAQIVAEMARRIRACCILVMNEAKQILSVAGTGKGRHKNGRFKTVYGAVPSAPGEPPHKQTGRLRASVTYEVDGQVGRVGTNLRYGRFLELGTRLMKARPWLRVALKKKTAEVQAILSKPIY